MRKDNPKSAVIASCRAVLSPFLSETTVNEIVELNADQLKTVSQVAETLCAIISVSEQDAALTPATQASSDTQMLEPMPYVGKLAVGIAEKDRYRLLVVWSPLVGVWYHASAPDASPFIEVGDIVDPGAELGLIEATKVFVPISLAGTRKMRVVRVLAANGKLVHEGDNLVLLVPED